MSPTNYFHYRACDNLASFIKNHLDPAQYGIVQDVSIMPGEDNTDIFPDIAVFKLPWNITAEGTIKSVPCFVAEVLSPSTHKYDRTKKKDYYEKIGVQDYWLVDPNNKSVTAYRLNETNRTYDLVDICQKFSPADWNRMSDKQQKMQTQRLQLDFMDVSISINHIFSE